MTGKMRRTRIEMKRWLKSKIYLTVALSHSPFTSLFHADRRGCQALAPCAQSEEMKDSKPLATRLDMTRTLGPCPMTLPRPYTRTAVDLELQDRAIFVFNTRWSYRWIDSHRPG